MRKNCSSDQEKILKFEAEGREFANFLRSLEQFLVTECIFNLFLEVSHFQLASNFKSFSRSLEQFFLTVGPNNFGNKIPFLTIPAFF